MEDKDLPTTPPTPSWCTDAGMERAFNFAALVHQEQQRKYTNEPYIYHPINVGDILYKCAERWQMVHASREMLIAALLHDTVEDCGVSFTEIEKQFGKDVRDLVFWLTDVCQPHWGNRATRKGLEAIRLAAAPVRAKIVKLCDLISNTQSIVAHDPDFARIYCQEKRQVLSGLHYHPEVEYENFPEMFSELFVRCSSNLLDA